jgi:hydroxymethylpyrimidine/phosphomethylpyrimidine kinase
MAPYFLAATLQHLADQFLAPFATLGTITTAAAAVAAFSAKSEAVARDMSQTDEDAYIQRAINHGLIAGFSLAFFPVCILFAEALT